MYVGGKLVEYTNQADFEFDGYAKLTYTANGEPVKDNALTE